jgi:hypothetical protein
MYNAGVKAINQPEGQLHRPAEKVEVPLVDHHWAVLADHYLGLLVT